MTTTPTVTVAARNFARCERRHDDGEGPTRSARRSRERKTFSTASALPPPRSRAHRRRRDRRRSSQRVRIGRGAGQEQDEEHAGERVEDDEGEVHVSPFRACPRSLSVPSRRRSPERAQGSRRARARGCRDGRDRSRAPAYRGTRGRAGRRSSRGAGASSCQVSRSNHSAGLAKPPERACRPWPSAGALDGWCRDLAWPDARSGVSGPRPT